VLSESASEQRRIIAQQAEELARERTRAAEDRERATERERAMFRETIERADRERAAAHERAERERADRERADHDREERGRGGGRPDRHDTPPSVPKLRMEGITRWPNTRGGKSLKFYVWVDQWLAQLNLVGYAGIIKADPEDTSVSPDSDAVACRYLVASLNNEHVKEHISSTMATKGRLAFRWLCTEFGLSRYSQSTLREEIAELKFNDSDDPRLMVILQERLVARLDPPPSYKEQVEMLVAKLGTSNYSSIRSIIKSRLIEQPKDESGALTKRNYEYVRNMLVELVRENQDARKERGRTRGDVYALTLDSTRPRAEHRTRDPRPGDGRATRQPSHGGRRDAPAAHNAPRRPITRAAPTTGGRPQRAPAQRTNDNRASARFTPMTRQAGTRGDKPATHRELVCVGCGAVNSHRLADCPKPRPKCSHPACGGQHLDRFCFWRHPELIRNPEMRQRQIDKIKAYERRSASAHAIMSADAHDDEGYACNVYALICSIQAEPGSPRDIRDDLESMRAATNDSADGGAPDRQHEQTATQALLEMGTRPTPRRVPNRAREGPVPADTAQRHPLRCEVNRQHTEPMADGERSPGWASDQQRDHKKGRCRHTDDETFLRAPDQRALESGTADTPTRQGDARNDAPVWCTPASKRLPTESPAPEDAPLPCRRGPTFGPRGTDTAAVMATGPTAASRKTKPWTANNGTLIIDSGASMSVLNDERCFTRIDRSTRVNIHTGQNEYIESSGVGTIDVTLSNEQGEDVRLIRDAVVFAPSFSVSVLSLREEMSKHRTEFSFDSQSKTHQMVLENGTTVPFYDDGNVFSVAYVPTRGGREAARAARPRDELVAAVSTSMPAARLAHLRFGHRNCEAIARLPQHVVGLPPVMRDAKLRVTQQPACESCALGKQHANPAVASLERAERLTGWGEISTDIYGPMPCRSYDHGYQYLICFCDHFTGWIHMVGLKEREGPDIINAFRTFLAETSTAGDVHTLLTDGAREYMTDDLASFCLQRRIDKRCRVAHNPNTNPYSERAWSTVAGSARALMKHCGCGDSMWYVAHQHAARCHNVTPRKYGAEWSTPYEKALSRKPDVADMRVFGCRTYALIAPEVKKKSPRSKLADVTHRGFYMGVARSQRGYIIFIPGLGVNKFHVVRNCTFDEITLYRDVHGDKQRSAGVDQTPMRAEQHDLRLGGADAMPAPATDHIDGGGEHDEGGEDDDDRREAGDADLADPDSPRPPEQPSLPDAPMARDVHHHSARPCGSKAPGDNERRCERPRFHQGAHDWELQNWSANLDGRPSSRLRSSIAATIWGVDAGDSHDDSQERDELEEMLADDCYDVDTQAPPLDPEQPPYHSVCYASTTGKVNVHTSDGGTEDYQVPRNFREAKTHRDWPHWEQAMRDEMASHAKYQTFRLVKKTDIPRGRRVCRGVWAYALKRNPVDGTIKRYKARWCVAGYSQRLNHDYFAAHSNTVRFDSVRLMLALSAERGMLIDMVDVKCAFLHSSFEPGVRVYVDQPAHFEQQAPDGNEMKCELLKCVYGTKQGSARWEVKLRATLVDAGFVISDADPGVYVLHDGDDCCWIAAYVDDLIICSSSARIRDQAYGKIRAEYETTELEPLSQCLGIRVTRDLATKSLTLDQTAYIRDTVKKYLCPAGTHTARSSAIPCSEQILNLPMLPRDTEEVRETEEKYRSLVGALNWIACVTRPDIAFTVSVLSRYLACAGRDHYRAAVRTLQYLMSTADYKIQLGRTAHPTFGDAVPEDVAVSGLVGFTDASFGTERPMGGYCICYGGAPISWAARRATCTPLSSCESEWLAATKATINILFMRDMMTHLGAAHLVSSATPLLCDNKAACQVSQNEIGCKGMSHIIRRVAWLREIIGAGSMVLRFVPGETQIADMMTKPLAATRFHKLRRCIIGDGS
jgi:hypothetical protein